VNIVAGWKVWSDVAVKLGRSPWLGRMMLIPLLSIFIIGILAFDVHLRPLLHALRERLRRKGQGLKERTNTTPIL